MVSQVNTGVPFPGGAVNAPGQEQQSHNTFFDALSISTISHILEVSESPYYIKAFGLGDASVVSILMCTKTTTGELQEPLRINAAFVGLLKTNNVLVIDLPGIYRLQIEDSDLGVVTVVGGPTALSYWSWGLKAFGAAFTGTGSGLESATPSG